MRDSVTSKQLKTVLKTQTDEIVGVIQTFVQQMDDRFDKIETRLDSLDQKYDHLIATIDGFLSRIDKYETERTARDNQFEKLLVWAHKVSKKTGIPLENL
jgi:DNA anti-recombination protein RmuC